MEVADDLPKLVVTKKQLHYIQKSKNYIFAEDKHLYRMGTYWVELILNKVMIP